MNQKRFNIHKNFFHDSNYAIQLSNELENNETGLIFDRFIHDIGTELQIDVVYNHSVIESRNRWFLGGNEHIEMMLEDENQDSYQLILTSLTEQGHLLLKHIELEFFPSFKEIIKHS
jgi:hypothetical protein